MVRIGDTVRRPAGPWTPTVHALLGHLHAAGFHGAPGRWAWTSSAAKSSPSSPAPSLGQTPSPCSTPTTASTTSPGSSATSTMRSPASARHRMPAGRPSSPPKEPASSPTTTSPLEPGHQPAIVGVHRLGRRRPRVAAVGRRLRPARLRAAQRQPSATSAATPPTGCSCSPMPTAGPGPAPGTAPHTGPADKAMHDFLAGQAATGTQPLGTAVARRPRPRLASRHRLHRRTGRHLAPRGP